MKPTEYDKETFRDFVASQTGLSKNKIYLHDNKYYVTSLKVAEEIIDYDLLDAVNYVRDKFDCDNYAFLFSSRAAWLYLINSFGRASGYVYDKNTRKKLGAHAFNLLFVEKAGIPQIYLYEPMTDGYTLIQPGKNLVLGNWIYEIIRVRFF